jgi:hypothetical protein
VAVLCLPALPALGPDAVRFPVAKAVIHRVPVPKGLQEVAPGEPCPGER